MASGSTSRSTPRRAAVTPGAGTRWITSSVRPRIRNGPLPTGSTAKLGAWASTASRGTIPKAGLPRMAGSADCDCSRTMDTTLADGVVIPVSSSALPSTLNALKPAMASSWAAAGDDVPFRAMRSSVYFTSAEVRARPLANVASLRRVNCQLVWSGLAVHRSAMAGTTTDVAGS